MKSVAGHTNLYRAPNGRYYFQRRIPTDLRESLPERYKAVFWKRSLGTTDLDEAKRKLRLIGVEVDVEITKAKQEIAGRMADAVPEVNTAFPLENLSPAQAEEAAELWVAELLEADTIRRADGRPAVLENTLFSIGMKEAKDSLKYGWYDAIKPTVLTFMERHGRAVAPDSPAFKLIARACLARIGAAKAILAERYDGETRTQTKRPADLSPQIFVTQAPPPPSLAQQPAIAGGITLKELIERYLEDPSAKRSEKTQMGYQIVFRSLRQLIGEDRPVSTITRDDCRRVRDMLLRLPTNVTKRYAGMTMEKAIKKAEERKDKQTLSIRSVNGYLDNLSALFGWAAREDYMVKNPATQLRVAPEMAAKDERLPFGPEQLRAIFSAPLYTGSVDDRHGYAKPGPTVHRRGRFWVPLLSLFHGLRSNEACQLLTADIIEEEGIPCIRVTLEDEGAEKGKGVGKRLKTLNAQRTIPLHPELTRIGFLAFVAQQRRAKAVRLFPEIEADEQGYFSGNISRWFGRFLEKAGAAKERTSFHSFRHNFRDALRASNTPRDAVKALGGWAGDGGTDDNYGRGLTPKQLLPWVEKIEYPGLDLSHLYTDTTRDA